MEFKTRAMALAVTLAVTGMLASAPAALAAGDEDLKELREQVRQLREQYEKRIESLERRLQQAEQSAGKAEAVADKAQLAADQASVQASSRPVGEGAMNPGISLILNGTYGNQSRDPAAYRINGFNPTGGEVAPPNRGLSLGESELVV